MAEGQRICGKCDQPYDARYDSCPACERKRANNKTTLIGCAAFIILLLLWCWVSNGLVS